MRLLRDKSGEKNRRMQGGKFVRSGNESVRGVWSGIHAVRMEEMMGGMKSMEMGMGVVKEGGESASAEEARAEGR